MSHLRDWIGSPQELGAYGTKMTAWFNELAIIVRTLVTDVAATVATVASHTASIATNVTNIATNTSNIASLSSSTSSFTFASGVSDLGAGFQGCTAYLTRDGMVTWVGVITNTSGAPIADGTQVIQAPAGYRPGATTMLVGYRAAGAARLDINTTGQMAIKQFAWPAGDFIGFAVTFKAA